MDSDLDITIRDALQAARGDWPAIAEESGVSYSWLSKFVNGHIDNPGFETLKKLGACLAARAKRDRPADQPAAVTQATA